MTSVEFDPDRPRAGGVLLHPTSLPGPHGIGDLGPAAMRWIDWLAEAGCSLWQVLPLGPTGFGDSPYQSFSAFAGNPLLVSPERQVEEGLLAPSDLEPLHALPADRVDFGAVIPARQALSAAAFRRFLAGAAPGLAAPFAAFKEGQRDWLDDFALFMALKEEHDGRPWTMWEAPLARRERTAVKEAQARLHEAVERRRFEQFLFFRQWAAVRAHARGQRVQIIGDVPIFVAHDSADVWSHRELFQLDEAGAPTVVAGVPPDYFSPTGQLWGNPLYHWDVLRRQRYDWWIRRLRSVLTMVDVVRLDHFRGFVGAWEVPAEASTAEHGRWVAGPGADFFRALLKALGGLPIVAEDLGKITPDVVALRDQFELPGMKILQFAFEGRPDHEFLPHNHLRRGVVYTGTHDNDTVRGWYESADEGARDFCRRYLGVNGRDIAWDMIRAAWASVAEWAIVPLQDLSSLGAEARMNYPSRAGGNWVWRARDEQLNARHAARLRELSILYGRFPEGQPSAAGGG